MTIARTVRRRIATISYDANNTTSTHLTGVTGRIRRLWLELTGNLVIATAGTNYEQARNPGTLVSNLLLRLNNQQVLKLGNWNDWLDRSYVFSKLAAQTTISTTTAATYPFASRIDWPFITPGGARPIDTILQLGPNDRLDLDVTWANDASLVANTTAQTVNSVQIDVIAEMESYIPGRTPDPIGLYKESTTEHPIGAAADANFQQVQFVTAPGLEYHHMILVEEDLVANDGRTLVNTINSLTLTQQGGGHVSQPLGIISGDELQHSVNQRRRLVDPVRTGVYPILFQGDNEGRITYNLDSTNLDDLRFILDIADPGASGYIRALTGTIERF